MAQETLKRLLPVVLSLPEQDQTWFFQQLRQHIASEDVTPYSMEEIDARLDETERQIAEGRYKTTRQVFHPQHSIAV